MKISFSNNGWDKSFEEIVEFASNHKIQGIEIHDPHQTCFKENPFDKENIEKTKTMLGDHQLSISCIDVIANIADEKKEKKAIKEILEAIDIASVVKCPYIRVRAFKTTFGMDDQIDERKIEMVEKVLPLAKTKQITISTQTIWAFNYRSNIYCL